LTLKHQTAAYQVVALAYKGPVANGDQCGSRLSPVAAGAVTVPGLGHVLVLVAVRSLAVLAESGVGVEPGGVDLTEEREAGTPG
jgi:hypothetical protein